ncbi:hypothetical protein C6497_05305 [Candidatus Poribacteria bacterium]|nr:MAG: hypothetical protein C6497_05305 [Candidatus Poribacteria bacterium]
MRKKMYWGIATLILLLGGFGVFLFIKERAEIRQLKEELAESNKLLEKQYKERAKQPPLAREGFKMVPHGDHWHELPIDAPGVRQEGTPEPNVPIEQPMQAPKTITGKLTYHKQLLEKHPVEAVRQQARELGHWSADHIPPFPPEDAEAAEFARELYLYRYYRWTGQTDKPEYQKHGMAQSEIFHAIRDRENKTPWEHARTYDLKKLTWPDLTIGPLNTRLPTTFTEGINPLTSRPLFPVELEMSNMVTKEDN